MTRTVLIVGGGIGGLTAALCLARKGLAVHVFEQSEMDEVGAGIQLSPNCTRILDYLGLDQALSKVCFLPEAVEMRHWKSGKTLSRNSLGSDMISRYGFPYYHVHRLDLIEILHQKARQSADIQLHRERIDEFAQTERGVSVNNHSVLGDVLIGADGIHSVVRAGLFGTEPPRFTGNVAWRGLVDAGKLPQDLVRPVATVWWGHGKHFVHYYVRRGELVNCVCVIEKSGWEVESWQERGKHSELKADFSGWHGTIQRLIDNMNPDECFKWALFDRTPLRTWSKGRVTLVGDACHPTLPFVAQGAAMAIEDAAVLADCLDGADDITKALRQYESRRMRRTARIQEQSRKNARIFHMRPPLSWLRDLAASHVGGRTMHELYSYNALEG